MAEEDQTTEDQTTEDQTTEDEANTALEDSEEAVKQMLM